MNSKNQDETSPPIEAYYAAPKHKFEELLDTSEWSLVDKICSVSFSLLMVSNFTFSMIDSFWIKHSQIIEGLHTLNTWLILVVYIWLFRRTNVFSTPIWQKWVHYPFLIVFGLASVIRPIFWILAHIFELTAFDF